MLAETWSPWQDVLQQQIIRNQERKVMGDEMISLLLSNSIRNFNADEYSNANLPENKVFNYSINQYLKLFYHMPSKTNYELLLTTTENSVIHPIYIKHKVIY